MLAILGRFFRVWFWAASTRSKGFESAVVPADVRVSLEEDRVVFLHIGEGRLFRSNASGRRIWQLLMEHRTLNEIAKQLSTEYGVPSTRIAHDARAFVANLQRAGLLAICSQE